MHELNYDDAEAIADLDGSDGEDVDSGIMIDDDGGNGGDDVGDVITSSSHTQEMDDRRMMRARG
jgi:hypothetical protein